MLLFGCGGSTGEAAEVDNEWTVSEGEITLDEDLFTADNDDFYFGRIYDVAVREDDRVYVADGEEHHVKVLSPEGELLETIGAQGEGPGEFERPSELVLARGDSLYVLDGYWGRVSVFAPDHTFAYSFLARGKAASPRFMMVPDKELGFLFAFIPFAGMATEGAQATVRSAYADGTIGDTLFIARPNQLVWEKIERGMRFYYLRFARSSHYVLGPEEAIHHVWSDSLRVRIYDRVGKQLRRVNIPFEAVPVTDADRERVLENYDSHGRSIVEPEMPDTKPAFYRFLIDDRGRYWFKRPTDDRERVDWWIVEVDARRVLTVRYRVDASV